MIDAAREYFSNSIVRAFPGARVSVKEGAVADATAFCFSWWMPDKSRDSLEVAVLLHAAAMNLFINATAEVRGRISERFERIIRSRLADGGYDPEDQSLESFKVHIYGPDLD